MSVQDDLVPGSCRFCGSTGSLTREHVFGRWVAGTGLDLSPVQHRAGPLNGIPRDLGTVQPYRLTVKSVCATCNNGWMSKLEVAAQRVLTPLILGESATIAPADQAVTAVWVHKTALTAMLISSREQQDSGYGISPDEYTALYERRDLMRPLDNSQFWVGRYEGPPGFWAVRVTPVTVRVDGFPEPRMPQGYVMTIVLGELVLQGLRFTTPALEIPVTSRLGIPQLWPSDVQVTVPTGQPCTAGAFKVFAEGQLLRSTVEHVGLRPWARATDLPRSTIVDGTIRVPAACKKHYIHYPPALLEAARRGRFYGFMTACSCPTTYLMQTGHDGTKFRAHGSLDGIRRMYEDLPGAEVLISDAAGGFWCKEVTAT